MMILNFDAFQKTNQIGSELDSIRIKILIFFKKKAFHPKKRKIGNIQI